MNQPINALILLFILITTFTGMDLHANEMDILAKASPTQRASIQTRFMVRTLEIDQTTSKRVEAINQKYAERMDPILKLDSGVLGKMRSIKSLQEEKDQELEKALTPDQFKRYKASKEELKAALIQQLQ